MKELNLLIVEDDTNVLNTYHRSIQAFNDTQTEISIQPQVIVEKDEALKKLKDLDNIFDAAIVDLDLKNSGGQDSSGNEIIREIKSNLRFPVFVISGTTHNLDKDISSQSVFFRVVNRDDDFDFVEEVVKIFQTGITSILNRKGIIEKYINEIFWTNLSNSMDNWINDNTRTSDQKQKSLIRYTLIHMQEHIDADIEKYHPSEFYITAPIKENLFTGDIITFDNKRYIVLTPSCDIILRSDGRRNTSHILFCNIKELPEIIQNYDALDLETGNNNNTKKKLIRLIENSKQNYHFIPKHSLINAGVIDFQDKLTIPENNVNNHIQNGEIIRIATVSTPFLKDIISRYSNYYSRQGSPDFDSNEVYNSLFKNE